jgi:hypothetical protein
MVFGRFTARISFRALDDVTEVFRGIVESLEGNAGIMSRLGHTCFLQNASEILLHNDPNIRRFLLLEWLYSPCGPSPLFSFLIYFYTIGRTP